MITKIAYSEVKLKGDDGKVKLVLGK